MWPRCSVYGCRRGVKAKSFCPLHYLRYKKYGDPLQTLRRTIPEPFIQISEFTALISLTRGYTALLDLVEAERLWNRVWWAAGNKRYIRAQSENDTGTIIFMHHEILPLRDGLEVDHINGNTLDNRKQNLRLVTHAENMQNTRRKRI